MDLLVSSTEFKNGKLVLPDSSRTYRRASLAKVNFQNLFLDVTEGKNTLRWVFANTDNSITIPIKRYGASELVSMLNTRFSTISPPDIGLVASLKEDSLIITSAYDFTFYTDGLADILKIPATLRKRRYSISVPWIKEDLLLISIEGLSNTFKKGESDYTFGVYANTLFESQESRISNLVERTVLIYNKSGIFLDIGSYELFLRFY